MLELLLAAGVLAAWYGFHRALRKGRAVTKREIVVKFTANMRALRLGFAAAAVSARQATEAMREFNRAWAEAMRNDRG